MTNIQLSEQELALLNEILGNNLTTLGVEIHRTDRTEFKQRLTQRHEALKKLLEKINATTVVVA